MTKENDKNWAIYLSNKQVSVYNLTPMVYMYITVYKAHVFKCLVLSYTFYMPL